MGGENNMRMQIWSKSLLKAYSGLKHIEDALNNKINVLAMSTSNINHANTAEITANKILKCIDKKVKLCETKVLIDDVLDKLNYKYATVLRMKYIEKKSYEEISQYFGVCDRTIRRYLVEALNYFSTSLQKQNYTIDKLIDMYKGEKWMAQKYLHTLKNYLVTKDKNKYNIFMEKSINDKEVKDEEYLYGFTL